jgi:hypothetical protein
LLRYVGQRGVTYQPSQEVDGEPIDPTSAKKSDEDVDRVYKCVRDLFLSFT